MQSSSRSGTIRGKLSIRGAIASGIFCLSLTFTCFAQGVPAADLAAPLKIAQNDGPDMPPELQRRFRAPQNADTRSDSGGANYPTGFGSRPFRHPKSVDNGNGGNQSNPGNQFNQSQFNQPPANPSQQSQSQSSSSPQAQTPLRERAGAGVPTQEMFQGRRLRRGQFARAQGVDALQDGGIQSQPGENLARFLNKRSDVTGNPAQPADGDRPLRAIGSGGFGGAPKLSGGLFGKTALDFSPLGLSDEQKQRIQQIRGQNGARARELQKTLKAQRDNMRDMMFEPAANDDAIRQKRKQVRQMQNQLEEIQIGDFLSIRKVLTAEQRQRFADLKPSDEKVVGRMMPPPGESSSVSNIPKSMQRRFRQPTTAAVLQDRN